MAIPAGNAPRAMLTSAYRIRHFIREHAHWQMADRLLASSWLAKTYIVPAGSLGVKCTTTNCALLRKYGHQCGHQPLQYHLFRAAVKLSNSMLGTNSSNSRRVVQANLNADRGTDCKEFAEKLSQWIPDSGRKRRHIGSKSREPPSPEGKREAVIGGFLAACGPRAPELCRVFLFSMARLIEYGGFGCFMELPGWSCAACFFITSHTADYPMARSDQLAILKIALGWLESLHATAASRLIRNTGVKEVWRYYTIRNLLSDVQVMSGQTVCAAYIHMYKV
eukprot:1151569-Pelagomonas_calceolata.AAC.2